MIGTTNETANSVVHIKHFRQTQYRQYVTSIKHLTSPTQPTQRSPRTKGKPVPRPPSHPIRNSTVAPYQTNLHLQFKTKLMLNPYLIQKPPSYFKSHFRCIATHDPRSFPTLISTQSLCNAYANTYATKLTLPIQSLPSLTVLTCSARESWRSNPWVGLIQLRPRLPGWYNYGIYSNFYHMSQSVG